MKREGDSLIWPELCIYTISATIAAGMSGQVPRAVKCGVRRGDVNVGLFGPSEWGRVARGQPILYQVPDDAAKRECEAPRELSLADGESNDATQAAVTACRLSRSARRVTFPSLSSADAGPLGIDNRRQHCPYPNEVQ
jgi:hypothetical protein